jgi:hypothetical protein
MSGRHPEEAVGSVDDLLGRITYRISDAFDPDRRLLGTAFAISPQHLVTALHTVGDRTLVAATGPAAPGAQESVPGAPGSWTLTVELRVPVHGAERDIVVLRIATGRDFPVVPIIGGAPRVRSDLHGLGFEQDRAERGGLPFTVRALGDSRMALQDEALLRFSGTPIGHGSSGSPLLNPATGEICAVVVTSDLGGQGHAFDLGRLDVAISRGDLPTVSEQLAYDSVLNPWFDLLSDEQIRTSGRRWPTRALREIVEIISVHQATHPSAILTEDLSTRSIDDLYEEQRLVQRAGPEPTATAGLDELLLRDESFVLASGPGGGKSTSFRLACARAAERLQQNYQLGYFPIPVTAADVDAEGTVVEAALRSLRRVPGFAERPRLHHLLELPPMPDARWTLLVDGLDEVVDAHRRTTIIEKLRAAVDGRDHIGVVLATRDLPADESRRLSDELGAVWSLEPLSTAQQKSLIRKWLSDLDDRHVDAVVETGPRELLSNPLLLTIACRLWRTDPGRALPVTRTSLLQAYYEALKQQFFRSTSPSLRSQVARLAEPYGKRAEAHAEDTVETAYESIGGAALDWLLSGTDSLLIEIQQPPAPQNLDARHWLQICKDIYRRTGLVETSQDDLHFAHRIIAEFVAAHACTLIPDRGERLLDAVASPTRPNHVWQNLSFMRFASGAWLGEPRFVTIVLTAARRLDPHAIELVAAMNLDELEVPAELRRASVGAAGRIFAEFRDPEVLRRAVRARVALRDRELASDLLKLCGSRRVPPDVRVHALLVAAAAKSGAPSLPTSYEAAHRTSTQQADAARWLAQADRSVASAALRLVRDPAISSADRQDIQAMLAATETQDAETSPVARVHARLARFGGRASDAFPLLEPVTQAVRTNHPKADLGLIQRAYVTAEQAHRGQLRKSGDPYITHPVAVATILAELGMTPPTLAAALLHDTVEDTAYSLDQLRAEYGPEIAMLVDGVTKLDKVTYGDAAQAETVRKMVVAMSRDIRVLVIKLADRLHNARTWKFVPAASAEQKAHETLEIYAPLAHRLGMNTIRWELEDLSFAALYPKVNQELVLLVAERLPAREEFVGTVREQVSVDLRTARIRSVVTGEVKNYYSIYQTMIVGGRDFADIYDLVSVRVLVDTVRDCYAALGALHARWNPVPGRFKDYIATQKPDRTQSLNTTVIGPGGKPVEIQIRTHDMHRRAEYGVAAHWKYKESAKGAGAETDSAGNDMAWLHQLVDWQKDTADPSEFLDSLRFEIADGEVYVFTPKGDVMALPGGSTPVDFAYAVHTEVGHRTMGARVNGRLVPLDSTLENGDVVEIFTSTPETAGPSRDWLVFVKSRRARRAIRRRLTVRHGLGSPGPRSGPDSGEP